MKMSLAPLIGALRSLSHSALSFVELSEKDKSVELSESSTVSIEGSVVCNSPASTFYLIQPRLRISATASHVAVRILGRQRHSSTGSS